MTDIDTAERAIGLLDAEDKETVVVQTTAVAPPPIPADDKRIVGLMALGLTLDAARQGLAMMGIQRGRQRAMPASPNPLDPRMIAYFSGRTDDAIDASALKAIKCDGGNEGPIARDIKVLISAGASPADADIYARALAPYAVQAMLAVRIIVAATLNEIRRRRALEKGADLSITKFLRCWADEGEVAK